MRKLTLLSLAAMAVLLSACAPAAAPTTEPTQAPTEAATQASGRAFVLGDIGDDPSVIIEGTQPIADYIASQLGDYGISSGEVKVAATADEMTQLLKDGKVDLYFDSA